MAPVLTAEWDHDFVLTWVSPSPCDASTRGRLGVVAGGDTVRMRWFGPEFDSGDLDQDVTIADYRSHITELIARAGDSIHELTRTNLHDGLVRAWVLEAGTFTWSLVVGDLRAGYQLATLAYRDATLRGTTAAELIDFDLCDPAHELVSDEIDFATSDPSRLEQRFSFWPGFVFAVQFSEVNVVRERLDHRQAR